MAFYLRLSGELPAILVGHDDRSGCIASVANCLAMYDINIGHMEVSRKEKGNMALMIIEVDQNINDSILAEIAKLPNITQVRRIAD